MPVLGVLRKNLHGAVAAMQIFVFLMKIFLFFMIILIKPSPFPSRQALRLQAHHPDADAG